MIQLSQTEQVIWDMYFVSALPQVMQQLPGRRPELIAESAAEVADEMLVERRERRPVAQRTLPVRDATIK
ncbi:hypothetical protein J3P89_00120 [Pseudomonas sp. Z1-14]|jgi:hypothetical protein|uniref:hypothetical protein n=1 Tax=unclassified Pseudomonas TaxID=196821 RepID=UPI002734A8BF|nr:hypothetical protein [Pseudomonas sp. FP198]WLG95924.1 hypothetical protein PSH78_00510 [Pseudomonas sp. FP198]